MQAFDFCVLGGGPAGMAFAILAAQDGARVFVAERYGYTRARAGEHLAGPVRGALDALGVPFAFAEGISTATVGIISKWGTDVPHTRSYGGSVGGSALNVSRAAFDGMLAERASAAGAHIVEGVVLDYAERSRSGWSLVFRSSEGEMNVQAKLIVDATGRQAQFVRHQGVGVKEIGDLFALATWLDVPSSEGPELGALVVEASFLGWCSLQMIPDAGYSAVFYTSRGLMRQKGLGASDLAAQMLSDLPYISDILSKSDLRLSKVRGFPSYPAVADQMYGPGWIAVGEAGAVFDPICGRGVELAFESAFRAYEAVTADPDFESLGSLYTKAISSKLEDHIIRRREVYEEAGHVFCAQFMNSAVQIAH